ncbi:MAG TPA: hypothetical protein DER09_04010 [Prolixibacteraceae bacterium]|nr:hypothetical protein [Prolixibacteraceae bacterium]
MKLIFNSSSCDSEALLLKNFETIYEGGFPDNNEREQFQDIINRVTGAKRPNEPHSIIVIKNNETIPDEVWGGLIADWYEKSRCIHLTYIIVDEKYRGKAVARELINVGIKLIKDWIKDYINIEIRNVFFESNNPELTLNDNFDPYKRLEIFLKMGAKRIDIHYIQPALDAKKEEVENLFLFTFPQFNADESRISTLEIIEFLTEFYEGLDGKQESLSKMINSLKQIENKEGYITWQQ